MAVGVITILGYVIAVGGIYIFAGRPSRRTNSAIPIFGD